MAVINGIPVILGLLGFIQPCTMGVNWAFVGHTKSLEKKKRLEESLKLLIVRASFYGTLGGAAGYLGGFSPGLEGKSLVLPMTVLSLIYLISKFKALPVPNIDLIKTSNLSVRQGMMIPSCVVPITIALLLISALTKSPALGAAYLSSFGAALTLPLLIATPVLQVLIRLVYVSPILAALSLMVITGLLYTGTVS